MVTVSTLSCDCPRSMPCHHRNRGPGQDVRCLVRRCYCGPLFSAPSSANWIRRDNFVADVISPPAIAAAPKRRRAASDLRRLLPYLRPYRARWIVMISAPSASLSVTVGIPIMTRAVIDGPVRHHDQRGLWVLGTAAIALGLGEAAMLFVRRWLGAQVT